MKTARTIFLGAAAMLGFIAPTVLQDYFAGNIGLNVHIFYLAVIANLLVWFNMSLELKEAQLNAESLKEELEKYQYRVTSAESEQKRLIQQLESIKGESNQNNE